MTQPPLTQAIAHLEKLLGVRLFERTKRSVQMTAVAMALLPQVPAVNEEIPGYEVSTWYGVFAPVKTPPPVIDKLNRTLAGIFATPDARARLAALGADPVTLSPAQFAAAVRQEVVKWAKVLGKDRGDFDLLITAAYIHDIGWFNILPKDRLNFQKK